jgi:DNA invertase Pin-like site-specific DNA recombinase
MTQGKLEAARRLVASGVQPRAVARDLGISIATLYRWLPASEHAKA